MSLPFRGSNYAANVDRARKAGAADRARVQKTFDDALYRGKIKVATYGRGGKVTQGYFGQRSGGGGQRRIV